MESPFSEVSHQTFVLQRYGTSEPPSAGFYPRCEQRSRLHDLHVVLLL